MSNLTYAEAQAIAANLAGKDTPAAQRLDALVRETGKLPTFFIMRHGDPLDWPDKMKKLKIGRPPGKLNIVGPFTVQHLETGERVTADTVAELLVKTVGAVTKGAQTQMAFLVRGQAFSYKDWYLADVLDTQIELKDIYGNEYPPSTIRELYKTRGLKPAMARRLLTGKNRVAKGGLCLKSTVIDSPLRPRNWCFKSLKARVGSRNIRARSISELAAKTGIDGQTIRRAAYGFGTTTDLQLTDVQIERKSLLPLTV